MAQKWRVIDILLQQKRKCHSSTSSVSINFTEGKPIVMKGGSCRLEESEGQQVMRFVAESEYADEHVL